MAEHWNSELEDAFRRLTNAADALRYVDNDTVGPLNESVMGLIVKEMALALVALRCGILRCGCTWDWVNLCFAARRLQEDIDALRALDDFHALDRERECTAQQRALLTAIAERVYRSWELVRAGFDGAHPNNSHER